MLFPLGTALLLSSCAPPKKAVVSPRFRYALESKATSGADFSLVSLRDTRTGKVLWKQRVISYDPRQVLWSKDHRALLIDLRGGLLIWRAGKPLLETPYAGVARLGGVDRYDYLMGSHWSPDSQRLLLSFGMSGMSDVGISRMFCMTFSGTRYKYNVLPSNSYVRDMGWRSIRIAFYYPAGGDRFQKAKKPRLWRVP